MKPALLLRFLEIVGALPPTPRPEVTTTTPTAPFRVHGTIHGSPTDLIIVDDPLPKEPDPDLRKDTRRQYAASIVLDSLPHYVEEEPKRRRAPTGAHGRTQAQNEAARRRRKLARKSRVRNRQK